MSPMQNTNGLGALVAYQFDTTLPKFYLEQLRAEKLMMDDGRERYLNRLRKMKVKSATNEHHKLIEDEHIKVSTEISKAIQEASNSLGRRPVWLDYVEQLDVELLAVAALTVFVDCSGANTLRNTLLVKLGKAVEMERWYKDFVSYDSALANRINKFVKARHTSVTHRKQAMVTIARKEGFDQKMVDKTETGDDILVRIGTLLYNSVLMASDMFEEVETTDFENGKFKTRKSIELTAEAVEIIARQTEAASWLEPMFRPMITPPIEWKAFEDFANVEPHKRLAGCYLDPALATQVPLVRGACSEQIKTIKAAIEDGSMQPMLDALNTIQATPYEINVPILEALEWAWSNNVQLSTFPSSKEIDLPKFDADILEGLDKEEQAKKKLAHRRAAHKIVMKNREIRGASLATEGDLRTARWLASGEHIDLADNSTKAFYLPHSWDFRSRVYPVCSFNHQRSDHIRALFQLHNKEPITQEGFTYVQLKVAEYGDFDKVSKKPVADRLQWVKDNEMKLMEIARDFKATFDGSDEDKLYWGHADKPFLFLAACIELFNALCHGSDDYLSGFPIGLDGSNSGVQHYSGLSLARAEGELTNLVPNEQPADIYQTVADETWKSILEDDPSDPVVNAWRKHGVNRSLVKRNVMTFPYSSKVFGFKDQLVKDFMKPIEDSILQTGEWQGHKTNPFAVEFFKKEEDGSQGDSLGLDGGNTAASYLAKKNWASVNKVISDAANGMDFIRGIAEALSKEGKLFGFTTPLGFPFIQRYIKFNGKQVRLALYDRGVKKKKPSQVTLRTPDATAKVDSKKSSSAASPNFIHCLDSLHLHSTVLHCVDSYGVKDFMLIHDSFATVPANAPKMFAAVRETFVHQYANGCLFEEVLQQAKDKLESPDEAELPEVPPKGDLNLEEVHKSLYCFL